MNQKIVITRRALARMRDLLFYPQRNGGAGKKLVMTTFGFGQPLLAASQLGLLIAR
jgi:hypothetical protein